MGTKRRDVCLACFSKLGVEQKPARSLINSLIGVVFLALCCDCSLSLVALSVQLCSAKENAFFPPLLESTDLIPLG